MTARAWLRPRNHDEATRTVFVLTSVASAVTVIAEVLAPRGTADSLTMVIMLPLLAGVTLASWLLRRTGPENDVGWVLFPLLSLALIGGLDLLTHDASVTAQVFLFFPALYGASQLRRAGALVLTAAAAVTDLVVVFALLPPRQAVIDASYVLAAIFTTVALLIRAGERNTALVDELHRHAATDPLTGLATRRVLDSVARSALADLDGRNLGTALLLLDVDNFKTINDGYGHPAGDEILIQLAALVNEHCRPADLVSRLGGDELAILLADSPFSAALQRAEALRGAVERHGFALPDGRRLQVSISVGLAHAPTHADELQLLYAAADAALYESKRLGRNRATSPGSVRTAV